MNKPLLLALFLAAVGGGLVHKLYVESHAVREATLERCWQHRVATTWTASEQAWYEAHCG